MKHQVGLLVRHSQLGLASLVCVSVCSAQAATVDGAPLEVDYVCEVLGAHQLDQSKFLALVRAGARAVPGLLFAVGDGTDETPLASRRRLRALRCLRLIGPAVAEAAMLPLLAAVARDISRDDAELLSTLAALAS